MILLVLAGTGWQWIGSGPGTPADPGGEVENAAEADRVVVVTEQTGGMQTPEAVAGAEVEPVAPEPAMATALGPAAGPSAAPESPAAPLAEHAVAEPAPAVPAVELPESPPGMDPDRFTSLVSAVQVSIAQHRFGEARLTLELVGALPLGLEQQRKIDRLELEYAEGIASLCREMVANVRDGEVLAARALLERAREGTAETRKALLASLSTAGVVGALDAPVLEPRERWPVPAPLLRERMVRARTPDRSMVGRVVDCRPERVTLRVETDRAVTFPTVARIACEPVDVRAEEAAEQGFAALHAGDVLLARLWLGCALLRANGEESRVLRLAALLQ